MSTESLYRLGRELERHHAVFYQLWQLGEPVWSDATETAGVRFDDNGEYMSFHINRCFWDSLSDYDREFVICHECLHALLKHGLRTAGVSSAEQFLCNIALDIVVNHLLVERFGFERTRVAHADQLCWVDTVFPHEKLPTDRPFEYYYALLKQSASMLSLHGLRTVDDHGGLVGDSSVAATAAVGELVPTERERLATALGDALNGCALDAGPGTGQGDHVATVKVSRVRRNRKWDSVIARWSRRYITDAAEEQWVRLNRRFACLSTGLMIPSEMECEATDRRRVDVWFMQDTSGSCWHLRERLFRAARSLDPRRFNVRMHCFDTRVHLSPLREVRVRGGGGTDFGCIEDYIRRECSGTRQDYPEAVFVLTDGLGTRVTPQHPDRWHWFLTTGHAWRLPSGSHVYRLSDYE